MTKVNGNNNVSAEYKIVNGKKVKKQEQPKNQKQVFNNKGQKTPQKPNDSAIKQEVYKKSGYQLKDTKDRNKIIQLKVNGKIRSYKTVGTLTTGGRILVQDAKGAYHVVSHTKDNKLIMLKDDYAKNKIFYESTSSEHKVKYGKKNYVITNSKRDRHGRMSAIDENGKRVVLSSDGKELKTGYVEAEDQKDNMNDYIAKQTKGKSKAEADKIRQRILSGNSSYSNKGVLRFKASNGEVWYYDTKRKTYVKYAEKEAQAIIKNLDKGATENWLLFRTGLGTDYELLKNTNAQIIDPEVLNKVNKHYSAEYGNKVDKNAQYGSGKYRTAYEAFLASEIGDDEVYQFNAALVKNNAITDQSRRNEILQTNLTKIKSNGLGVSGRANRLAAADAASTKEDYQALQDAAEEENKKKNYKAPFKGSDALQTYIYGVNNGDVQEIDDFNTTLIDPKEDMLDRDEIVKIKAETGALWAKQGKYDKAFEAQDGEIVDKMFALQDANGKASLNVKELKAKAKGFQGEYLMFAKPELFTEQELADKAVSMLTVALDQFDFIEKQNSLQSESVLHNLSHSRSDVVASAMSDNGTKNASKNAIEASISKAYTLIRNDKVLNLVKQKMGDKFNLLQKKEQAMFKTNTFANVTTKNDNVKSNLSAEEVAQNKYVVSWLKNQLEDLERDKKLNEQKEGWKQTAVDAMRTSLRAGETRESLANKYDLIKSNMARLEAAAEGKLVDKNGKPVSFEDAIKNLGETGIQALEQANADYQTAQQTGEFMVDMAVLALPLPKGFNAANTVIKMGNALYKVISKSDKVCKVIKITQEAIKGSKIYEVATKVATTNPKLVENTRKVATIMNSSATGAMHMAGKTVALDASNIATSREGFTSDRNSEMNTKTQSAAVFGGMGGAIGGTTAVASEFVSSAGAKYAVHGVGLVADLMGAAGLMTAESHGETNFWDNLRCVNPDGSFNFEQASMTAMMIFGHLHGMSAIKGKPMPKAEIQADGTVKYTLNNNELKLNKDGIYTDSETGRKFKLATNKNSKTELVELTKKEIYNSRQKTEVKDGMTLEDFRQELKNNDLRGDVYTKADGGKLVTVKHSRNKYELFEFDNNNNMISKKSVVGKSAINESYPEFANAESSGTMGSTSGYLGMNKTGITGNKTTDVKKVQGKVNKKELTALRNELGIYQTQKGSRFEYVPWADGSSGFIHEKRGNDTVTSYYVVKNAEGKAYIQQKFLLEKGKAIDAESYKADGSVIEDKRVKQLVLENTNKIIQQEILGKIQKEMTLDECKKLSKQYDNIELNELNNGAYEVKFDFATWGKDMGGPEKSFYERLDAMASLDKEIEVVTAVHNKTGQVIKLTIKYQLGNSRDIEYNNAGKKTKETVKDAEGKITGVFDGDGKPLEIPNEVKEEVKQTGSEVSAEESHVAPKTEQESVIASESEGIQPKPETEATGTKSNQPAIEQQLLKPAESDVKYEPLTTNEPIVVKARANSLVKDFGIKHTVEGSEFDMMGGDSLVEYKGSGIGDDILKTYNFTFDEQGRPFLRESSENISWHGEKYTIYRDAHENITEIQHEGEYYKPKNTENGVTYVNEHGIVDDFNYILKKSNQPATDKSVVAKEAQVTTEKAQKTAESNSETYNPEQRAEKLGLKPSKEGNRIDFETFIDGEHPQFVEVDSNGNPVKRFIISLDQNGKPYVEIRATYENGEIVLREQFDEFGEVVAREYADIPVNLSDVDNFLKEYPNFEKSEADGVVTITNPKENLTIKYDNKTRKKIEETQIDQNGLVVRNTFNEDGFIATRESDFVYEGNRYHEFNDVNKGTKSYQQILDKNTGISTEVKPELAKKIAEGTVDDGKFTPKGVNEDANMGEEVFSPYEVIEQNAEGKPTKTVLKNIDGKVLEYNYNEYDSNGNVAKTTSKDATGKVTASHEFEYDSSHNLTKETVKDAEGKITGIYDGKDKSLEIPESKIERKSVVEESQVTGEQKKSSLILSGDERKPVKIKTAEEFAKEENKPVQIKTEEEFAKEDSKPVEIKTEGEFAKEDSKPVEIKTEGEFAKKDGQPVEIDSSNTTTEKGANQPIKLDLDTKSSRGDIDAKSHYEVMADKVIVDGEEFPIPQTLEEAKNTKALRHWGGGIEYSIEYTSDFNNSTNRVILKYDTESGKFIGSREEISINGKALKDTSRNADGTIDYTHEYLKAENGQAFEVYRDSNGKPTSISQQYETHKKITFDKEGNASYEVTNEKNETVTKPIEEAFKDYPELKPLLEKQGIKLVEKKAEPVAEASAEKANVTEEHATGNTAEEASNIHNEEVAKAESGAITGDETPVTTEESASAGEETPVSENSETADAKPSKISMFDRLFHKNKVRLEHEVEAGTRISWEHTYKTQRDENGYVRTKTDKETNIVRQKEYFNAKGKKIKTETFDIKGKKSELTEGNVTTIYNEDGTIKTVEYPNHKNVYFKYNDNGKLIGAQFWEGHNDLHPKNWNDSEYLAEKRRTNYEYNSDKGRFELLDEKGKVVTDEKGNPVSTATFDPETRHWVEDGQYSSDLAPKTTNVSRGEGRFRIKLPERNKVPKNLRDENGKLREGVTQNDKGYIESITKDEVVTTKNYDSKGTLVSETTENLTKYYNKNGDVICTKEILPGDKGVKITEKTKDYDLEIIEKDGSLKIIHHTKNENGTAKGTEEFKYSEKNKVYENTSPEGNVLKTVAYDVKNHSWTIKDGEGKKLDSQNNMKESHIKRNIGIGIGTGALVLGGIAYVIANSGDDKEVKQPAKPTAKQTPKKTTPAPKAETKVTLDGKEGTIAEDGTLTLDGKPYPKAEDGTYTIGDKKYKVEDGKLVEVVDTPDDNGETGGAAPDESPEVKGTVDGKEYTINSDGSATIGGHMYEKESDGYYHTEDGSIYGIGEDGKLVKIDKTQTGSDGSQAGSAGSATQTGSDSAQSGNTGNATQTGSDSAQAGNTGATSQQTGNTNTTGNNTHVTAPAQPADSSASTRTTGTTHNDTSVTTRHTNVAAEESRANSTRPSERSEESRANSSRHSERSEESRANSSRHSERSEESRHIGNTPVTEVTEPTEEQMQVAKTLQDEISSISTQADVKAFFTKAISAYNAGKITLMQLDVLKTQVENYVETLNETIKIQNEQDAIQKPEFGLGEGTTPQEPQRKEKQEITPVERMELTQKIRKATDRKDIEEIQKEMRQYKVFPGRKNLRRAYKAKLRAIKHQDEPQKVGKYNKKFEKRMDKIENSKVYKNDEDQIYRENSKKMKYIDDIIKRTNDFDDGIFNA